jgi:hypothetical protein
MTARDWVHIQRDFSGGEISGKMLMRADTEVYKRSALEMVNFYPTMQGSANRVPGTRFIQEVDELNARIIPYLTRANERAIVLMTPENLTLISGLNNQIAEGVSFGNGLVSFRKQVVQNFDFWRLDQNWTGNPEQYVSANGEGPLGVWYENSFLNMIARKWKIATDAPLVTCTGVGVVDTPTNVITLDYKLQYVSNFLPANEGQYRFRINLGTTAGSANIWSLVIQEDAIGTIRERTENITLPTVNWTGTIYITITLEALNDRSTVHFQMDRLGIFANGEVVVTESDLSTPYSAADLQELHYVQSPYDDKELVITHPKHEPHRLYFDTGGGSYVFEPITFTNTPAVWGTDNYPATCTSFLGRLVLAGGNNYEVLGSPITSATETVWATEAGDWDAFTSSPTNPDDSVEFTAIYRSPIQWVFGQKTLLIGAQEMEYVAEGSAIFGPGDVQVFLHSTHGSTNVQPAAFGEAVLFAADGGTKVRSMRYSDDDQGWLAPDMTLLNPGLTSSGILRMVRARNPHQMCVVLTNLGELAVFHSEGQIAGWSRYRMQGAAIRDVCVQADDRGLDVIYLLVERRFPQGVRKLFLEAIPNWNDFDRYEYTCCTSVINLETESATITGLDHINGRKVYVYDDVNYYGVFTVSGGSFTITDQAANEIPVRLIKVGLLHRCYLKTLPPETHDPGAKMRYSDFAVRVLFSTRPIINGERPAERFATIPMNQSQPVSLIGDFEVTKLDWDPYQIITVEEDLPLRCEVLGVYGKLAVNSR